MLNCSCLPLLIRCSYFPLPAFCSVKRLVDDGVCAMECGMLSSERDGDDSADVGDACINALRDVLKLDRGDCNGLSLFTALLLAAWENETLRLTQGDMYDESSIAISCISRSRISSSFLACR